MKNEFLTAAAASRLAEMDPRAFKKILDRGEIKSFQISRDRRILYRSELERWLQIGRTAQQQGGVSSIA